MPTYPNVAFFELASDWACEVASPDLPPGPLDEDGGFRQRGPAHLWLVNPLAQLLEVYALEGQRWVLLGNHGAEERVRVEPFDAVEFDLARWWPPIG